MNKKEIEIKKHSAVVQISNKITAQQRKVFNGLIYIARSILKEQPKTYKFCIDLANLKKLVGINSTNNTQLKQALEDLVSIVVKFNILGKDKTTKWGIFAMLAGVTIDNGVVEFGFAPQIYDTLLNPKIFLVLDLNVLKGLTSKYSISLYELAKDYIHAEIPQMTIEEFRELMGLEEHQYKNSAHLKRKVIDLAVSEISEKTDINVKYSLITKGKKVISIKLYAEEKKILEDEDGERLEELFFLLPSELNRQKSVKQLLNKFLKLKGYEYVKSNITYSIKNAKKNLKLYLQKSLEGDWAEEHRVKEILKKCKEEADNKRQKYERDVFKQQNELQRQVKEYQKTLTKEELEILREEAISQLDEETKKNAESFGNFEVIIKMGIDEIIGKRLTGAQSL